MSQKVILLPVLPARLSILLILSVFSSASGQEVQISKDLLAPVFSLVQRVPAATQNQPVPSRPTPSTIPAPPVRPRSTTPSVPSPAAASPFNTSPFSRANRRPIRLASVPNMIGDLLGGSGGSTIIAPLYGTPVLQTFGLTNFGATAIGGGSLPVNFFSNTTLPGYGGVSFPTTGTTLFVSQATLDQIKQDVANPGDTIKANISAGALQTYTDGNISIFGAGVTAFTGGSATLSTGSLASGIGSTVWDLETNFTFRPLLGTATFSIPSPSAGGAGAVIGRMKIAENNSPLPRDRVFFNYSYFHNVPLASDGVGVNRFTPGFEKTFYDGLMSIELRVPFASTIDSNLLLGEWPDEFYQN